MESKLYSDIILSRPEVASPHYHEQLGNLGDALDEIIASMLAKLSMSTGKLELGDDSEEEGKGKWTSGNRNHRGRNRGKRRSNTQK